MTNLIVDGSFEEFDALGVWDTAYAYTKSDPDPVYHGVTSLLMDPQNSSLDPKKHALLSQVLVSGLPDQVIRPTFWVYRPSFSLGHVAGDLHLRISSDPYGYANTVVQAWDTSTFPTDTWIPITADDVTLPCESPRLEWLLQYPATLNQHKRIYIDLVESFVMEANMAVMLMELPLRALLATLQASLNTEIGHVNTEANDGITCPNVGAWFCWDREQAMPEQAEVSVYEDAGGEIAEWGSLVSNGQRTPIRTSWTLVVRLAYANRSQLATSKMRVMGMRYAAALVRCIRNAPHLGQTTLPVDAEPSTPIVVLERATGTDPKTFGFVEMRVAVTINESPTGETVLGGGTRPAATLES